MHVPSFFSGPEWGRAVVSAVNNSNMAIALSGFRFGMGDGGLDWGEMGCLGGVLDHKIRVHLADIVVASSRQHVSINMTAHCHVTPLAGLSTTFMHCL